MGFQAVHTPAVRRAYAHHMARRGNQNGLPQSRESPEEAPSERQNHASERERPGNSTGNAAATVNREPRISGFFPGCAGDEVRNTPLDLRVEERIVEIVRARGCGIMKKNPGWRRCREFCRESAPHLTRNPRLPR